MRAPKLRLTRGWKRTALLAVLMLQVVAVSAAGGGSKVPTDVTNVPTCSVPPVTFASWFKSGTVTLDGEVTPADSINFPDVPNCTFYTWSERMFLWLTSPTPATYGGGGGRIFNSPAFFDVSPADANHHRELLAHKTSLAPTFQLRQAQLGPHEFPILRDLKTEQMFELEPTPVSARGLPMIQNVDGQLEEVQRLDVDAQGVPHLFDPADNPIDFIRHLDNGDERPAIPAIQKFALADETVFISLFGDVVPAEQAEADLNVLMAQNNSLVYYTIEVNDVFGYLASGVNSGSISASHFPVSAADEAPILSYAMTKGVSSFPDPEALAIELKTAWVEAKNLPSNCDYITLDAEIPDYDTSDPMQQVWPKTGTRVATLAMIGMHVVGSTKGHPEMIWATFEHRCNAPTTSYTYNGTSPSMPGPPETGPWLLSSTDTPATPIVSRMFYNAATSPPQIEAHSGQTIGPIDVQRVFPWGIAGSNTSSNTEIIATDHAVLSQLVSGDVRGNYIMTGATWRPFGALSGSGVGTNKLANTTMETFAQGSNCFNCHLGNPLGDANGSGHSHIFGELLPLP